MDAMSTSEHSLPDVLKARVLADLRPVRPLASPWKRALLLLPIGLALLALTPWRYGVRHDIGGVYLWGLSLLQVGVGFGLVVASLREVLPDRSLSGRTQILLVGGSLAITVAVTYLTWNASLSAAVPVSPADRYPYWKGCLQHTVLNGLPALVVVLALAIRGLLWRPALVGGLAGLAAGLLADASWRTYCGVSEPAHVFSAHVGGIVVLAVLGAIVARIWTWATGWR
jgi:hypothetical protein